MNKRKVLTFWIEDTLVGIDIALVKEVQRYAEYSPVPGAPPHLLGLMNLRGQVVTMFDIKQVLTGMGKTQFSGRSGCVILKPRSHDPHYTGFLIDRAGEVLEFDPAQEEHPPANMRGLESRFLQSIVPLPDALVVIIRLEDILDSI